MPVAAAFREQRNIVIRISRQDNANRGVNSKEGDGARRVRRFREEFKDETK